MSYEKEQFSIMDDLMNDLAQTDVFCRTFMNDPMIKKAEREIDRVVESLNLPRSTENELTDSINGQLTAYISAAILYGFRAYDAIRFSSAHADDFSAHVMERIQCDQEESHGVS